MTTQALVAGGGGGGEAQKPKKRRVEDGATLVALRKKASETHGAPVVQVIDCMDGYCHG
jgi:hypothetical protein